MLQSPLDHTTGHPSGEVEPQSPFKYFACVNAAPIDSRESLKLRGREPLGTFSFRDLRLHLFHSPSVITSYVLTSRSSRTATRLGGSARNSCREDVIQDSNDGSRTTGRRHRREYSRRNSAHVFSPCLFVRRHDGRVRTTAAIAAGPSNAGRHRRLRPRLPPIGPLSCRGPP